MPGRIRSPEALPLLCRTAREGRGDLRDAAIASLGFLGAAPAEESFMIFGGGLRSVVFPAAPSGIATKTLLGLLREARSARTASEPHLLDEVLRALRTHRGPDVAAAARETLVGDFSARVTGEWEHLAGLLVKNLEHVGMKRIVELAVDEHPHVRKAAALVLGWSASADAVAPLLRLLGDGKAAVRNQAHDALTRLGGERPDPRERETRTAEEWASTFGKNGERLDPERSLRHEDPEPGVYRIGR